MPSNHLILFTPFSSCPQSFPASGPFPMSQLFTSGGQSIGASASALVLPMNIQDWFLLGLTALNSLQTWRLLSLLQHHISKASILQCSVFFMVQLSYPYMTTRKNIALTMWTFVSVHFQGKPFNHKGNQPWIFIGRTNAEPEAPILWPPDMKSQLIGRDPDAGKEWNQEESRVTEDETVEWHHRLNGHESEQTPRDSEGQESLVCCSSWGRKESDTT